jgi:putative transposase
MHMPNNVVELNEPSQVQNYRSALDQVLRQGAQDLLRMAIQNEVDEYIQSHSGSRDEKGRRLVVRNGHLPERQIQTPVGNVSIRQPRVEDRRPEHKFLSKLLPPYLRRTPSVEALIPALYLRGLSTGDFSEALTSLLGPNAAGLSPANIVRLKENWTQEFADWSRRDLSGKRYVYWWVDGIYFNVRLDDTARPCVLVLMGALENGAKELIAVVDGERESKLSWQGLLSDLKKRGLTLAPKLAVGDGALGFWAALEEEYPGTGHQRCWVHKTVNVLDKLPRKIHATAKAHLHEMYLSPTRTDALQALQRFFKLYQDKYPKACECLRRDESVLLAFYDFPAAHWAHLRTTNPIESTFATVRHRTRQTKGCGSREATLSMVFKLASAAEKRWRKLNGSALLAEVIQGVTFHDGELAVQTNQAA